MGHRESGCLGEGKGRPLCWSETCRAGSLRPLCSFFFAWYPKCSPYTWYLRARARSPWSPYSQACCYDTWFFLQVLSGIVRAGCKRHAAESRCEPVGQLTFQGPKSLCVLDKLFIVVLALPGPSDSNKCSQTGKEEIRNHP